MTVVANIFIYPDKDKPGQELESVGVSEEGLDGDRRKKSPVHLVTASQFVTAHPRANLVLDMGDRTLDDMVGRRVRVGDVVLEVTSRAGDCPGVYAVVPVPGAVSVDDLVTVETPESAAEREEGGTAYAEQPPAAGGI
jgi:uncharacterized protein YcbX